MHAAEILHFRPYKADMWRFNSKVTYHAGATELAATKVAPASYFRRPRCLHWSPEIVATLAACNRHTHLQRPWSLRLTHVDTYLNLTQEHTTYDENCQLDMSDAVFINLYAVIATLWHCRSTSIFASARQLRAHMPYVLKMNTGFLWSRRVQSEE